MARSQKSAVPRSRYEFRVWGHQDEAHRRLLSLADSSSEKHFKDCYLLIDDPTCNLKIRRNRLKVKRLVEERFGFQRWSTDWHKVTTEAAPHSGGAQAAPGGAVRTESAGLGDVVEELHPAADLRPLFVTKHRMRFRFGSMRAEVTDLEVGQNGERLCTTAIEGRDLLDLIRLRSSLGLDLVPNVAVHLALDPRFQAN
jgi:hypothetical protein